MWQLVKSEMKYNWKELFALGIFFLSYSFVELLNYSVSEHTENTTPNIFELTYFSFFYILSYFVFFYIILYKQAKTNTVKLFALLPLTNKKIAVSRLLFSTIPFTISIIYFALIQIVFLESKQSEISYIIFILCRILLIIASMILIRDSWLSYSDIGDKHNASFIAGTIAFSLLIVLSITYYIITTLEFPYTNIQHFLLGLIVMLTTIYSFQKRKSYLS